MSVQHVAPESKGQVSMVSAQDSIKLKKACQELEAVFLSLLWKNMAKQGGIDLKGWSVLAEEAIGKNWAESGGIGLAKVIYNSVSKSSPITTLGDDGFDRPFEQAVTKPKTKD